MTEVGVLVVGVKKRRSGEPVWCSNDSGAVSFDSLTDVAGAVWTEVPAVEGMSNDKTV